MVNSVNSLYVHPQRRVMFTGLIGMRKNYEVDDSISAVAGNLDRPVYD